RYPDIDGTVVPCAAAGSLMFTPDICLPALRAMHERFGASDKNIWGRYGFVDAFNPTTGWVNPDVIGIDVGITLLSAENLRSGNIWRWFMRNAEIPRAMRMVGLVKETPAKSYPGALVHTRPTKKRARFRPVIPPTQLVDLSYSAYDELQTTPFS